MIRITSLFQHQGFRRYFANTAWLFAEKILRMLVGLFVGVWVARYLGPEKFGLLSYVGAFIGLFAPLGKLGLDGIISREIAKNECDIDELISTAVFFKFIGSILIVFLTSSYMYFTKEQNIYFYLSIILSMVYVLRSYEVMEFYFRAKVKAKYISIANSVAFIISSILKVFFILLKLSLVYFAVANLIETFVAVSFLYMFFKNEPNCIMIVKVKFSKGMELIKESWPLIFSGFFALVYLNIDQVMIEEMLSSYGVGQYSAAVRISSVWYFIPLTIGWSVQTAIVNAKKHSETLYFERLQLLFTVTTIMAYFLILPISYFSNEIINFLFGKNYQQAGGVLAIHIFASLFVFINVARGTWILNESYFKFALLGNIGAGLLNILFNYIWLPRYGIYGAAWATLISYSFTYLFSGLFFAPARKIVIMQLKSICLIDIFYQIKSFKKRRI
jgi:O-antigen/teichoic acid export membrane protein